jgi:hypothetical protein
MNRRAFLSKVKTGSIALASLPVLGALAPSAWAQAGASIVRWDLISLDFTTTPMTIKPGGVDNASIDADNKIQLSGSGFFVALPSGEPTNAVTGGGTWQTSGPLGGGSGTFEVVELLNFQVAHSANPPNLTDTIADRATAAGGNAILRIQYSDGSQGILGIGCSQGDTVEGILEGVIATKGYLTYWNREAPVAGVDGDRTVFHMF